MEYQSEFDLESAPLGRLAAFSPRRLAGDLLRGLTLLWTTRNLAIAMASRELRMRYAGQFAGAFWAIGHPLVQIVVYIFLFGIVFKQRIGGTAELPRDYTTYMLSGLVPWLTLSTTLPSLCASILSNANLVKQFTFKAEILAVKDVLISFVFWTVGVILTAIYILAVDKNLPLTLVLLPIVLALNTLFVIGLGWMLSAFGVFVRDLKDVVTVLVSVGIYVLPVVYLPSWAPALFRPFIEFNPLSAFVWVYQDTIYFGRFEHPYAWIVFAGMSVVCFSFGYGLFQTLKPFFGRVL